MPRGSRYKKCTPIPRSAYFNVFILPYESSSFVASCLLNALKRTLPPPRDTLVSNVSAISKTTPTFLSTFQVCTVIAEDTRMPGRTNLSCRFEIRNLPRMNLSLSVSRLWTSFFPFFLFFLRIEMLYNKIVIIRVNVDMLFTRGAKCVKIYAVG